MIWVFIGVMPGVVKNAGALGIDLDFPLNNDDSEKLFKGLKLHQFILEYISDGFSRNPLVIPATQSNTDDMWVARVQKVNRDWTDADSFRAEFHQMPVLGDDRFKAQRPLMHTWRYYIPRFQHVYDISLTLVIGDPIEDCSEVETCPMSDGSWIPYIGPAMVTVGGAALTAANMTMSSAAAAGTVLQTAATTVAGLTSLVPGPITQTYAAYKVGSWLYDHASFAYTHRHRIASAARTVHRCCSAITGASDKR